MTIVRSPRIQRDFTIVSNSVCMDPRLSMRALGMLVRLLSRPDDWHTNSESLAREFDCGRDQIRGVLRELADAGYMQLRKERVEGGKFTSKWYVFDIPQPAPEEPGPGNRGLETRTPVDQALLPRTDLPRTDTNPLTPKGEAKRKRIASSSVTLREWMEDIKTKGEDAIPVDDPIFAYASDAKIPYEFLSLSWKVFRADMLDSGKKQADWRATFRNYVKKGYLRLWFIDGDGGYALTTTGKQAALAHGVCA